VGDVKPFTGLSGVFMPPLYGVIPAAINNPQPIAPAVRQPIRLANLNHLSTVLPSMVFFHFDSFPPGKGRLFLMPSFLSRCLTVFAAFGVSWFVLLNRWQRGQTAAQLSTLLFLELAHRSIWSNSTP
jgi:hypothetical protein